MLRDNDPEMLTDAIRAARDERRAREPFWKNWIKSYHGRHWRSGAGNRSQMNYAYVFVSTFLPALAFRSPKIKLKPAQRGSNTMAAEVYQNALNGTGRSIGMLDEMRMCILDSFYAMGIGKTGLVGADYMTPGDNSADPGNTSLDLAPFNPLYPYFKRVSPFSFLWDDTATRFRSCQFLGEEFDRDAELLVDDPRYDLGLYDPAELVMNHDGELHSHKDQTRRKMPKCAHLIELFLRDSRRLVTLVETGKDSFIIARSVPYWGPDNGPYRMLQYTPVPDAVVPMNPGAGQWDQLCDLEEQQFELAREIKSEKRVVAFKTGGRTSAQILREAKHDHIVTGIDDVGSQVVFGGASKERAEGVSMMEANYYFTSALSDVMRGVVSSATATAVDRADRNANLRLDDMRLRIREFGADAYSDMFFYAFYDENVVLKSSVQVPGTGSTLNLLVKGGVETDPETGQPTTTFDTTDFAMEIDAESMYRVDGPVEMAQALEQAQFMLTELFPTAMQFGYMPDIVEFTRDLGERIGRPGMEHLLIPMTPEAQMMYMQNQMASQASGAATGGAKSAGGAKPPLQNAPGGEIGQMMRETMNGSGAGAGMMQGAGMASSPSGQANKAVKGNNQNSFTDGAPKAK